MKRDLHLEVRAERMYTIMFISCSPFVACPYCPSTTRSWDVAWRACARAPLSLTLWLFWERDN